MPIWTYFTSSTAGTYSGTLTVQRLYQQHGRRLSRPELGSGCDSEQPEQCLPCDRDRDFVECWYAYSPYPNVQTL